MGSTQPSPDSPTEGDASAPLRALVIGARRARQGIGYHLARFLHEAGVEVAAICGTSQPTTAAAADAIANTTGRRPGTYLDAADALHATTPDMVVVASPDETHERYLELALAAGAHVLAEKPFLWGGEGVAARAAALARRFLTADRHLVLNTQWPLTLPTYRALYPELDPYQATRFQMRLSPMRGGRSMIPAALPHALSLLAAVAPGDAQIANPSITLASPEAEALEVHFDYQHAGGVIAAEVSMVAVAAQPRPASYGFDGYIADRQVELPGYEMSLSGQGRTVPLRDPTPLLVRSFVDRVRKGAAPTLDPGIVPGVLHLLDVAAAWPDAPTDPIA